MTDELAADLVRGIEAMAAQDAAEVVAEARAEARLAVKELLREELERSLLARSRALFGEEKARATQTAPLVQGGGPPADSRVQRRPVEEPAAPSIPDPASGDGWWTYCVVSHDHPGVEDVAAVEPGEPVRLVREGAIAALVSPVPLDEYGEEGLRRNLNELPWLERVARAHEAVLEAALSRGTVVPMRVCTIYSSEDHVRGALAERRRTFEETLELLDGRAEWGVKVFVDEDRMEEGVRVESERAREAAEQVEGMPEGGAYLARKKLAAVIREEAARLVEDAVAEAHARLEEWASASTALPPQNRELSGHVGSMALNGAYLVDDARSEAFARVVEELHDQYRPLGIRLELTGPWPAHHFTVPSRESERPVT